MHDLDQVTAAVMRQAPALRLFARQWVDPAEAEDAVQEALAALLGLRQPPDDPVAWMFRAVRNAAIDYARGKFRRRRREQVVAKSRGPWFEPNLESSIDAKAAETLLRELSDDKRQIVVMRIWGDLGYAQIAQLMQLSTSAIHDRYRQALTELRNTLEKPCRKTLS
jgi:RNA polymerase sigma-70 factor (ECF subfamily)